MEIKLEKLKELIHRKKIILLITVLGSSEKSAGFTIFKRHRCLQ